jgi:hypothetical protein
MPDVYIDVKVVRLVVPFMYRYILSYFSAVGFLRTSFEVPFCNLHFT